MLGQEGHETAAMRLRALPLAEEARAFIERYPRIYVVENNWDGQMAIILRAEYPDMAGRIQSLAHSDGLPLTPSWITRALIEKEGF